MTKEQSTSICYILFLAASFFFFFLNNPQFMFLLPPALQATSSCPPRSLRRKSKVKRVKIYPQSPRSYSSTQQRNCMQKSGTKILMRLEQRSARRPKLFLLPLRLILVQLCLSKLICLLYYDCNVMFPSSHKC